MADSCMRNASTLITGTVQSLWTWLWGRYHVPQNVFLVKLPIELLCEPSLRAVNCLLIVNGSKWVESVIELNSQLIVDDVTVVSEMTQFQTIVSGFIQHIEGISSEVEKEKLKVSKQFL